MTVAVPIEIWFIYGIPFVTFATGMAMVISRVFRQDVLSMRPVGRIFQRRRVGVAVGAVVFVDGKR